MKWLLILYFSTGAQATYRTPFDSLDQCEIARSLAESRQTIYESLSPNTAARLVYASCAPVGEAPQ